MSLVLDSSVALAWHFEDERTQAVEKLLHQVAEVGAIVPGLWRYEVANGLQMGVRRSRISASRRDEALADMAELGIQIDAGSEAYAWSVTLQLAARHGLTVYDAAYLELAQRRRVPLATLDTALAEAAKQTGIAVLPGP